MYNHIWKDLEDDVDSANHLDPNHEMTNSDMETMIADAQIFEVRQTIQQMFPSEPMIHT